MRPLILLLPIFAVAVALTFRGFLVVRYAAVGIILFVLWMNVGGFLAPHRVAEELIHTSPQTDEWHRGARDTRDVVYRGLPIAGIGLISLTILSLVPVNENHNPRKTRVRTE